MTLEPRFEKLEEYILAMSVTITKLGNEMRDFKDEMRDFKDEMKVSNDKMNIQWGNLANQLGRVVEDLIIPNIGTLISKYFEEEVEDTYGDLYKRKDRSQDGRQFDGRQFDGIVTTKNYVFLFEVKNQVTHEYTDVFHSFVDSGDFFDYFSLYKGKQLVPIMGSINLKEHQITMLTESNILALSIKGDFLTFKNYDKLSRKL